MNNTSANGTIVLFDLYSSTAEIIGYSFAYGILSLIALVGEYSFNIFEIVDIFIIIQNVTK